MKSIILATAIAALSLSTAARAEDSHSCGNVPKDKWMTKEALTEKVKTGGITVRRVKVEGDCYEVYGMDAKGGKIERLYNPETGAAVGDEEQE